MEIIQIISTHKRAKGHYVVQGRNETFVPKVPIKQGCKRVEAIVKINGELLTRHIDIPR